MGDRQYLLEFATSSLSAVLTLCRKLYPQPLISLNHVRVGLRVCLPHNCTAWLRLHWNKHWLDNVMSKTMDSLLQKGSWTNNSEFRFREVFHWMWSYFAGFYTFLYNTNGFISVGGWTRKTAPKYAHGWQCPWLTVSMDRVVPSLRNNNCRRSQHTIMTPFNCFGVRLFLTR